MNARDAFHRQLLEWCRSQLGASRPLVIGVQGVQGCGKSTVTRQLCELLAEVGLRAVSVSIDDFYLTRNEQVQLAAANPGNRFLQNRGYPGTHALALGVQTLGALRLREGTARLPVFDKSLHDGKGDRAPESQWKRAELPLDIVFFEGWMLGFHAVDESTISDPALREVNRHLTRYESWWTEIDVLLQLKAADLHYVIDWRMEAEAKMKAEGKSGMTEAQARAFVTGFLPAYELYLATVRPTLAVEIGKDRLPT